MRMDYPETKKNIQLYNNYFLAKIHQRSLEKRLNQHTQLAQTYNRFPTKLKWTLGRPVSKQLCIGEILRTTLAVVTKPCSIVISVKSRHWKKTRSNCFETVKEKHRKKSPITINIEHQKTLNIFEDTIKHNRERCGIGLS